jgi:uncharacterized membrane protein (Fun14 family)
LDIEYTKIAVLTSKLQIEEIVFFAGGGFLFGTAAGYAVKKLMKIATVVIGLLVAVVEEVVVVVEEDLVHLSQLR